MQVSLKLDRHWLVERVRMAVRRDPQSLLHPAWNRDWPGPEPRDRVSVEEILPGKAEASIEAEHQLH